jgi:hypothetical protein
MFGLRRGFALVLSSTAIAGVVAVATAGSAHAACPTDQFGKFVGGYGNVVTDASGRVIYRSTMTLSANGVVFETTGSASGRGNWVIDRRTCYPLITSRDTRTGSISNYYVLEVEWEDSTQSRAEVMEGTVRASVGGVPMTRNVTSTRA